MSKKLERMADGYKFTVNDQHQVRGGFASLKGTVSFHEFDHAPTKAEFNAVIDEWLAAWAKVEQSHKLAA